MENSCVQCQCTAMDLLMSSLAAMIKNEQLSGKWSSQANAYTPDCAELMICVKQRPNSSITAFSASTLDFLFCSLNENKLSHSRINILRGKQNPYRKGMTGLF